MPIEYENLIRRSTVGEKCIHTVHDIQYMYAYIKKAKLLCTIQGNLCLVLWLVLALLSCTRTYTILHVVHPAGTHHFHHVVHVFMVLWPVIRVKLGCCRISHHRLTHKDPACFFCTLFFAYTYIHSFDLVFTLWLYLLRLYLIAVIRSHILCAGDNLFVLFRTM